MNPVCAAEVRENQQTDKTMENNQGIEMDTNIYALKNKYIKYHKVLLSLVYSVNRD